jgi:hypothetical protein
MEQSEVDAASLRSQTVNLSYHMFLMEVLDASPSANFRRRSHAVYIADVTGSLLVNPVHPDYVQPDRPQRFEQFYHNYRMSPDTILFNLPVDMEMIWTVGVFDDQMVICRHHIRNNHRQLGVRRVTPVGVVRTVHMQDKTGCDTMHHAGPIDASSAVLQVGATMRLCIGAAPRCEQDVSDIEAFVGENGCIVDLRRPKVVSNTPVGNP